MSIATKRALAACLLVAGLGLAASTTGPATAATQGATASDLPEFEGRVVSINRDARTFRVRTRNRGIVRFKVKRSTRFEEGLKGFGALRKGFLVEVDARRSDGRWIAVEVERQT